MNGYKVLILEDEISINRGIAFSVERAGFEAVCCHTVAEAKVAAATGDTDIIICDINLPDGSGLDFIAHIRSLDMKKRPYIICLTVLDTETDYVLGYESGADDYICKPFSLSVLMLKLEAFVNFRNRTADSYDVASEISGKDLDRINRQLKRISDMIRIVQENAALEKEDTRSVVTDIAHQLKTPLAASKMNIELLTDETLSNTEKREFFNRLRFSMEELETLMNSLVNISRMETGLIKLDMKRLPVEDTLRNSVSCIIGKAEEKEIAIEVVSDEDAQEPICHDSRWLCEAFINVLDNSIKYSPHGSCIKITVTRRSAYFRIDFEDEGIGIPKNEYHKAMSRFYRGSHEEVKNTKGSGVGLYLVNKIVRMHNGMVTIRSGHGKSPEYPGTVIIIQIPL